jgi:hypothetical protein
LIIVSEAAKRRFLEIKPAGSSNGEAMRLDTLRVSPNGKEPRVASRKFLSANFVLWSTYCASAHTSSSGRSRLPSLYNLGRKR